LVADSTYGVSQRVSSGFDQKRLSLLLAILEKKQGFRLAGKDVFVNLAGGLRIDEPAIDLGVMSAIVSSHQDTPVRSDSVLVGEVGLGGEIRSVPKLEARIREAINLGFSRIVVPSRGLGDLKSRSGIKVAPVSTLDEAFRAALE